MLEFIKKFFDTEKTVYSHRHRSIEVIALEKKLDIDLIRSDTKSILELEGRTEVIGNCSCVALLPTSM